MAILTEEQRSHLSDNDFAVPGKRKLPIHDAEHARLAWDMLDATHGLSAGEREEARARIMAALHRHGVRFGARGRGDAGDGSRVTGDGGDEAREAAGGNTDDTHGYVGHRPSVTRHLSPVTPVIESGELLVGEIAEARVADEGGHVVEVTIARPGVSQNGYLYPEAVLRAATPLWQGAPAFLDHPTALDTTRAGGRSLRDLVGVYEEPRYDPGRGIRAMLRLLSNDHGVFETVRESVRRRESGRAAPPIGVSADWKVLKSPGKPGPDGRARWNVHAVTAVNSGDVVIRPSAGGSFDRILEGTDCTAEAQRAQRWEVEIVGESAVNSPAGGVAESGSVAAQPPGTGPRGEAETRRGNENLSAAAREMSDSEVRRLVESATQPLKAQLAAAMLESKLAVSGLPAAAREHVRGQLAGRVFEASEADAAIGALKGLLGEVFGQSSIRGVGAVLDPGRVQGTTPLEKVQAAFDRLFGLEVPGHLSGIPRLSGIREAYILVTGDRFFTGSYQWEESIVREANETTTSVMSNVVLNSMTKRLVKDYQAQPKWWEPIAIKTPILDMKQQNRIRLLDFGSLSSVTEDAAYTNVAWGDARENYTPSKFGNLVVVTLEMFLNDDLHAVVRIPTKLAHAAVVTINEQVSGLFTQSSGTGPTMSDTFHVFDATNHQGNTSASTPAMDLSSSALQTAMTTLEKMQNAAGKRIGVRGRYLLIPPDLRWTAAVITQSQYAAGTANNDINPLAGAVVPIVVPQLTTAYQWYLLADPAQIESLEIGFLNGREEPELLVQDNPTAGQVFTNDAISYKVRHIYGLGWLDYRGAFAALPTS